MKEGKKAWFRGDKEHGKELMDKLIREYGAKNMLHCMVKRDTGLAKSIEAEGIEMSCEKYEMVNHPSHYNMYGKEVIDMMVSIWGKDATAQWCEMTAFKYRMRMGSKPDNDISQDLAKEAWYLSRRDELKEL